MPRISRNRVDAVDDIVQLRNSFEMNSLRARSVPGRSLSVDEDSLSTAENDSFFRAVQTVRRARSLHRNAAQNAVCFLPSRHITNIGAVGTKLSPLEDVSLLNGTDRAEEHEHQVEHIVQQMEKHDDFMEDSPDAEELRLGALRDMPQCLTVKRNIRAKISASVSRKSKRSPIGVFKRTKYRISFWGKRLKQNLRNLIFSMELWYESIRGVEGHFGSGVATYFRFLRWLFIMNFSCSILLVLFIVLPQTLYSQYAETDTVSVPFAFGDLLTGQGYFTNTTLYYGYYTNKVLNLENGRPYNIPYSYIFTMFFLYLAMFIALSIRMARSYRRSFIETAGGMKNVYAHKIFCGWDFGISSAHAASLKSKSIYNDIRELLSESYKTHEKIPFMTLIFIYLVKIAVHALVLALLALTGFIMWTLMHENPGNVPDVVNAIRYSDLKAVFMALIITIIMVIFPIFFSFITRYESYNNPRTTVFITLIRTFALEVVVVSMLCIFWLKSHNHCWETSLGQEVYRLIIFDFLFSIIAIPVLEFFRSLISKHLWGKIGTPEFDIARNTLGLIYNQTLLWMGLFYSPLLGVIVSLKMAILFYVKRFTIMRNCQPSSKSWRAAQTHTFFLVLIFMSLLVILLVLGYIFTIVPTGGCGPFKSYDFIYLAILEGILNIKKGNTFFTVIMYVTKPGVIAFILIAMCVGAYYLRAKSMAQIGMVSLLRDMLVLESKDKEFLLQAIAKVSEGQWVYSQKNRKEPYFETSGTWKYASDDDKMRTPSNAGFQFEVTNSPRKNSAMNTPRSAHSGFQFDGPSTSNRNSMVNTSTESTPIRSSIANNSSARLERNSENISKQKTPKKPRIPYYP